MNGRERLRETMRFGRPDRAPLFEDGLRDGVLERWHEQGLPKDADITRLFEFDRRERIPLDFGFRPEPKDWPTSRSQLRDLKPRLDASDPARFPRDWPSLTASWRGREHVLELPIYPGFFQAMGVHRWDRFLDVACLVGENPALVREMMAMRGEFTAQMVERVLREVEIDFVTFSEPIGGNEGPLLSPRCYEELALPAYQPAIEVAKQHRVETIVFLTYANARALMPVVLRAGFNCLWACEVNPAAMDYRVLRHEFGRDLRLIGGIDLDALLQGEDSIRRETEEKAGPLLAEGGYVPLADGRVRENVRFEDYAAYRRVLEKAVKSSHH